ncbi:flagellar hook-basal body complex protein FliE [Treponema pallidum]|uniref:flagellar hook-basal body complex protein FliE n=1 Tax=Treponema pallidum TaxID=160 RepID=UPI000D52A834|nr:flagellar hook-basal body complex protein FliE [Treponema pallidum]AWG41257.1 flagellar hook-basal body complex protein FliE [Treponema pallidum subsp. pertenue]WGK73819.1 flagellar hook-basal body complex protein FliE [Treponema pallidum subsp. pertenue]WGK74792.1 flagellar hook-basal body complex protein FliE [Treponema pallidum subsp. pertenue]
MTPVGTITNSANVYKVPSLRQVPEIGPVSVESVRQRMRGNTDAVDQAVNKKAMSFEQTLLRAFDQVNQKQQKTAELTEQMIVDPESVDVHDVTVAMAEASMSLKIAQTVIDKVLKSWNDVTTAR